MIPYILVALFPLLVESVYAEHQKRAPVRARKKRWVYILIAALPAFLLIGLRHYSLGNDTYTYLHNFTVLIDTPWDKVTEASEMEPGYLIFVKLLTYITHEPLVYQLICASIYYLAVFTFCNQLERSPFLTLFFFVTLGVYTFMFTGVRQCLAMSVCLFAFFFIRKRKPLFFLLLVALAYAFHHSAALFVVAYFIYRRRINIPYISVYAILGVLAVVYLGPIQAFLNNLLDYDYDVEYTGNGEVFFLALATLTIASIIITMSYKSLTIDGRGCINIAIIALFFWFLRLFTRIAERPSYYFLFFSCAMVAFALDGIPKLKERFMAKTVVVSLCMLLYIYRLMTSLSNLVPYAFY